MIFLCYPNSANSVHLHCRGAWGVCRWASSSLTFAAWSGKRGSGLWLRMQPYLKALTVLWYQHYTDGEEHAGFSMSSGSPTQAVTFKSELKEEQAPNKVTATEGDALHHEVSSTCTGLKSQRRFGRSYQVVPAVACCWAQPWREQRWQESQGTWAVKLSRAAHIAQGCPGQSTQEQRKEVLEPLPTGPSSPRGQPGREHWLFSWGGFIQVSEGWHLKKPFVVLQRKVGQRSPPLPAGPGEAGTTAAATGKHTSSQELGWVFRFFTAYQLCSSPHIFLQVWGMFFSSKSGFAFLSLLKLSISYKEAFSSGHKTKCLFKWESWEFIR